MLFYHLSFSCRTLLIGSHLSSNRWYLWRNNSTVEKSIVLLAKTAFGDDISDLINAAITMNELNVSLVSITDEKTTGLKEQTLRPLAHFPFSTIDDLPSLVTNVTDVLCQDKEPRIPLVLPEPTTTSFTTTQKVFHYAVIRLKIACCSILNFCFSADHYTTVDYKTGGLCNIETWLTYTTASHRLLFKFWIRADEIFCQFSSKQFCVWTYWSVGKCCYSLFFWVKFQILDLINHIHVSFLKINQKLDIFKFKIAI